MDGWVDEQSQRLRGKEKDFLDQDERAGKVWIMCGSDEGEGEEGRGV